EDETARHSGVGSRALAALLTDPDPSIRGRAERHFRRRVESGGTDDGEQPWRLTEDLPPETASRIAAGLLDENTQPDPRAVELAWKLWLSEGDEQLWRALRQRQPIPGGGLTRLARLALGLLDAEELYDAATDPVVPLRVRQRC